ncbi:unnamed protein product, partial [Prorocentrum cordatum]
ERVPWNEIFDAPAHGDEPEFEGGAHYMGDPLGTDADSYGMTLDDEQAPGPANTHPTTGRRQTGKRSGRLGYRPEGSAEEETPGPQPDFDASGPDESADPEAKRPRFASEPEVEIPVETRPAQPRQQNPDPISVGPETPLEQPMFDREQFQTPWAHRGVPDLVEDLDADEEQETPRAEQHQASAPEPETPVVEELRRLRRLRCDPLDDVPTSIRQNLQARGSSTTYDPLDDVPHSIRRSLQDRQITKKPRVDEHLIMGLSLKESVDFDCSILYSTRFRRVDLVGKSRGKELIFRNLTGGNHVKLRKAMASEWDKWLAFHAARCCSKEELAHLKRKRPQLK